MSSSWNTNWDPNTSSQQLYFPQPGTNVGTLSSANGDVQASYDSRDMSGVNWHQDTWPLQSGHDARLVEAWMHQNPAMEGNTHQAVGTRHTPVVTTQYPGSSATATSASTHVATSSADTDFNPSSTAFLEMNPPSPIQTSAAETSPTTPTSFEASPTSPDSPNFSVSFSEGTTYYQCDCGYETTRKTDMRRHHESSKHVGQKYFCSLCGRGYTRKYNLEQHEKKHN
ncbi:hypothetical protein F5887DRAFT_912429 [Amanita rubescens]|nr:hypothetical protein F5887DRAFT_912429 [Amanita rubescens]